MLSLFFSSLALCLRSASSLLRSFSASFSFLFLSFSSCFCLSRSIFSRIFLSCLVSTTGASGSSHSCCRLCCWLCCWLCCCLCCCCLCCCCLCCCCLCESRRRCSLGAYQYSIGTQGLGRGLAMGVSLREHLFAMGGGSHQNKIVVGLI